MPGSRSSPHGHPTRSAPRAGCLRGSRSAEARSPNDQASRPTPPPAAPSSRLSVISCRISRPRAAPSAARIASSRMRPDARASRRLATFAQAMSRTTPTAPSRMRSAWRTSPTIFSCSGWMAMPRPPLLSGKRRDWSSVIAARSARASSGRDAGLQAADRLEVMHVPVFQQVTGNVDWRKRYALSARGPTPWLPQGNRMRQA